MPDFNTLFPNFTNRCVELQEILIPIAYLLIVGGMITSTITGHRSGAAYVRTFGRTIVFIVVMTFLVSWGNSISSFVDMAVKDVLKVDPTKVYDDYQQALQMQKTAEGEKSWWEKAFQWRASLLEAILTGVFFFFGWIAGALVWWAYLLQTVILFVGYGLSPIFIGFLSFQTLHEVGKRYFLNLVGVMMWPLGWGVAGLVTQSMIDFMTDRTFLHAHPIIGSDVYSFQNLMGVAFLGIWLIFSTIAAPVIMQKAIATGSSAASRLMSGAFAAGRTAATAGATTLATVGSGVTGGSAAVRAGAISAATAFESLGAASINGGYGGGSLIGTSEKDYRDQKTQNRYFHCAGLLSYLSASIRTVVPCTVHFRWKRSQNASINRLCSGEVTSRRSNGPTLRKFSQSICHNGTVVVVQFIHLHSDAREYEALVYDQPEKRPAPKDAAPRCGLQRATCRRLRQSF